MPKLDLNFYLKFEASTLNHQFSQMIYLKLHKCNYYPQFLHFRNKRIYVSVPDKNLKHDEKKVVQLKHDSPDYQKISDTANKRHQGEEGWSSGHYLVHQR